MERGRKRRFWASEEKRRIVAETHEPGASVSMVARRHDVNANLVFTWRRDPRFNGAGSDACFLPVEVLAEAADVAESEEPPGTAPSDPGGLVPKGTSIELERGLRLCFGEAITETSLLRIVTALRCRA